MRKAQVTLFIVVGLVLALMLALLFLRTEQPPAEQSPRFNEREAQIKTFLETCIDERAQPVIRKAALQGGIINTSYPTVDYELPVAVQLLFKQNRTVPRTLIENEIANNIGISTCIADLGISGIGEIGLSVTILPSQVLFYVDEFLVEVDDGAFEVDDLMVAVDVPLGDMLSIRDRMIEALRTDAQPVVNTFDYFVHPVDSDTTMYSLYDNATALMFTFAVKDYYNMPPMLDFIPDMVLYVTDSISYDVNATDTDTLRYYSDYALIAIDAVTGLMRFDPISAGAYDIEVCAEDTRLLRDCAQIHFTIEDE